MALAVRIRDSSVTSNIAVSIMRSLQARQVRRLAPAVCLGVVLAGCAGTPRITALHDPLYRADGHTSTITATARVTQSSIAEIRIEAISGTPAWCPTGSLVPSLMPCRTNAVNIVSACGFSAGRTEASCALNRTITGGRMISYRTTTRAANGRTASTPWVTYAAGPWPLTEYQLNLGIIRVQLDIEAARPVIWRTDAPGPAAAADKIDLGFVPDADYFAAGGGNYRQFSDDISSIATRTFYTDTRPSTNFTRTWRNIYNLWAGPRGADGEGCTRNFNQQTNAIRAALDGVAIVHRNAFRDCATLTRGAAVPEPWNQPSPTCCSYWCMNPDTSCSAWVMNIPAAATVPSRCRRTCSAARAAASPHQRPTACHRANACRSAPPARGAMMMARSA